MNDQETLKSIADTFERINKRIDKTVNHLDNILKEYEEKQRKKDETDTRDSTG